MASTVYNEFKRANMAGEIDMNADDIRAILVMTNTTADTENDGKVYVSDIGTLDECNATGYGRVALASETVTKIDATDRAKFSSNDVVFSGLSGNATRNAQGIVLYKHVGADSANPIIAYIDFTAPISNAATQVTVPCPTDGWFYLT